MKNLFTFLVCIICTTSIITSDRGGSPGTSPRAATPRRASSLSPRPPQTPPPPRQLQAVARFLESEEQMARGAQERITALKAQLQRQNRLMAAQTAQDDGLWTGSLAGPAAAISALGATAGGVAKFIAQKRSMIPSRSMMDPTGATDGIKIGLAIGVAVTVVGSCVGLGVHIRRALGKAKDAVQSAIENGALNKHHTQQSLKLVQQQIDVVAQRQAESSEQQIGLFGKIGQEVAGLRASIDAIDAKLDQNAAANDGIIAALQSLQGLELRIAALEANSKKKRR